MEEILKSKTRAKLPKHRRRLAPHVKSTTEMPPQPPPAGRELQWHENFETDVAQDLIDGVQVPSDREADAAICSLAPNKSG